AAPATGAWPTATPAGSGRRPGGWPTAAAPASGRAGQGQNAGQPQQPQQQPGRPPAPAPAPQAPAPAPTGGLDPRALWPNILEAVKNRRRFTWILLSQNAQVTGFDGTTLQLGFVNVGARDNFASSGSEDVLRQALAEQFNVQWKIEAVVDPSGGGAPQAPVGASGYGGAPAGGYGSAPGGGYGAPAAPRPAAPQAAAQAPAATRNSAPAAPAPAPQSAAAPEPPPVAPEDDIPEDDDPDLDESALSGHELIVRELGATVVEEFTNE
ncbi:DNA polymerase III subunit gamma and tau, partial [Streptomyces sp. MBT70]|nr:DNA polymerase III subunit gamma and tau [Streptomyces sp. MBT70]